MQALNFEIYIGQKQKQNKKEKEKKEKKHALLIMVFHCIHLTGLTSMFTYYKKSFEERYKEIDTAW